MITSLRKRDYSDEHSSVWEVLMQSIATECRYMWETGVLGKNGERYKGVVLAVIGDWPFLHKSAGFVRSFNNIQKRVHVRTPPAGICHQCRAGQVDHPFEQLQTKRPSWIATWFLDSPCVSPSPFETNILHVAGKSANIWSFDWFHTMHLGVMKNYIGSVLAMLSALEPHSAIDDRFSSLSDHYKAWCLQFKHRAHVATLSKESVGWETTNKFPTGTWHKGALSTILMKYLEFRFKRETFPQDPLLAMAAEACYAIQDCHRMLYRLPLWLNADDCKCVSDLGFRFLRRYAQLASAANASGRNLFIYPPKIHILQKFMVKLHHAYQQNVCCENPLARSCQQSEDFIGRPARISRRVTAQKPVLHRVMDRYLQSAHAQFVQCKFLIRP